MKKILIILTLSVLSSGYALKAQNQPAPANVISIETDRYFAVVDSMINLGKKFMGVKYVYGGNGPQGFDCSGFVSYLFGNYGFKVSKASRDLAKFGNEVNQSCLQPGDLAFFKGRSTKSSDVGHVALVINAFGDRFDMIHATVGKGIWIDRNVMDIAYYKQRFLMFRRPFEIK